MQWTFGQKLTMGSYTYWGTDSKYQYFGSTRRAKRRDCFTLTSLEDESVTGADGTVSIKQTRMCCESVCFFTITGLKSQGLVIPVPLRSSMVKDTLTLILGRYFSPHPSAVERDSLNRPVCPGPLSLNHCLWIYARSQRDRQMLIRTNGSPTIHFENQRYIFGNTDNAQLCRLHQEKNAYFCIHTPNEIYKRAEMTQEFVGDTLTHSENWLESVVTI